MKQGFLKTLCGLTAASLLLSNLPPALVLAADETNTFSADVNGDGSVDEKDTDAILDVIASSIETLSAIDGYEQYDANGNGIVDAADALAVEQYRNKTRKTLPAPSGEFLDDSLTFALTDSACFVGEDATLDFSIVDWSKDIAAYDFVFHVPNGLEPKAAVCTGSERVVVKGNAIRVFGLATNFDLNRGKIASLTFHSVLSGEIPVALDVSNVYDSELNYYHSVDPTAAVTVHDPFAPVALIADGVSSKSALLTWETPYSEQPISGYGVFRDGELIADCVENAYLDTKLTPDTEYTYTVCTYNVNGEQTKPSLPLTLKTAGPQIQNAAFPAEIVAYTNSDLTVKLAEKALLSEMTVQVGSGKSAVTDTVKFEPKGISEWTHHLDVSKLSAAEYPVKITVKDLDGATDATELTVYVQNTKPSPLTIQAHAGGEAATLTWEIAPEADVTGYRVYRQAPDEKEMTLIGEINNRAKLDYTDSQLSSKLEYTYGVTAVNSFGIESEMSNLETVKPEADTTAPEIERFYPAAGSRISGEMEIIVTARDNSVMDHVACLISADKGETWKELFTAEGSEGRWTLNTADYEDGAYQFMAMAYDKAGNKTPETSVFNFAFDNTAPEQVTGIALKEEVHSTFATIEWNDVAAEDFSAFLVVLSTANSIKTYTVNTELGINVTGLTPGAKYSITVSAVDASGNVGEVSEPFFFETPLDDAPPVITGLKCPSVMSAAQYVQFTITAEDNSSIVRYYIDISQDKKTWQTFQGYSDRKVTVHCETLEEGTAYIRAYAEDTYGNKGNPDEAEIVEITVDNTAPEAVTGFTAKQGTNSISLSWEAADTAASYTVQRSTKSDFSYYENIKSNTSATSFTDTALTPDTTYYYRIAAFDSVGNQSEYSEVIEVHYAKDETAPVIDSVYLSNSGIICDAAKRFQVIAIDEVQMSKIDLSYSADNDDKLTAFTGSSEFTTDRKQMHLTADLPADVLKAKTITIRVVATDAAGNACEPQYYTYTVNNEKTEIKDLTATISDANVLIAWDSPDITHTRRFDIYRTVNDGREYCLTSFSPVADTTHYTFTDNRLDESGTYVYRVVATQDTGNTNSVSAEPILVQSIPRPVLTVDTPQQLGASYFFDATASQNADEISSVVLDYGDGSTDTASKVSAAKFTHTYKETGSYTATLTCTNAAGASKSIQKTIVVEDLAHLSKVQVTVKTTSGQPAKNATVYVDVGTDAQVSYETDANGCISFTAKDGDHEIGVFGQGYLPVTKTVSLIAGAENKIDFSVVCDEIVDATFKITRMSLSEIKAAGIDVEGRQNLNIVRINVELFYSDIVHNKEQLKMFYDYDKQRFYLPEEMVERGYEVHSVQFDKNEAISAIVLMNIPTEVQSLKEFFKVSMIVTNNADTQYSLNDTSVTLNVPGGLTIMEQNSSPRTVTLGTIGGQKSAEASWIIRGDARGSYTISADIDAVLSKFNETVHQNVVSDKKVTVLGSSALDVQVNLNPIVFANRLLAEVVIQNVSSIPVYEVSADIKDTLYEINHSELALGTATLIQSRFTGKDKILKVLDDMPSVRETLNPGETFSLLYSITGFNGDYNLKTLYALGDTLKTQIQGDAKVTVNITPVSMVDVNSPFYGIAFDREKDFLLLVRNNARRELPDAHVCVYTYVNNSKQILFDGDTDERGRVVVPRGDKTKSYYVSVQKDNYKNYYTNNFHFPAYGYSDVIKLTADFDNMDYQLSNAYLTGSNGYHNLLRGSYALTEGDGQQFDIHVTGVEGVTKYQLMQGSRTIDTVTDDSTSVTFDGLKTNNLHLDDSVFVRCYIETGEYVDTPLNLMVVPDPTQYESTLADNIADELTPDTSLGITLPDWLEFAGGIDINISFPAFLGTDCEIEFEIDMDGVVSFEVDFNGSQPDEGTGQWNPTYASAKKLADEKGWKLPKKFKEFKFGKAEGYFAVGAMLSGEYDSKTGDFTFTGRAVVTTGIGGEIFGAQIGTYPFYFGVDMDLSLGTGVQVSYSTKNGEGWKFRVLLNPTVTVGGKICLGAHDAGKYGLGIGIKGEFTANLEFIFPPCEVQLFELGGGIYLHIDYVVGDLDIRIWDGMVQIYPPDRTINREMLQSLGLTDEQVEEINKAVQEAASQAPTEKPKALWNGTIAGENALNILETNCAGTSKVQLVPYGDTAMMIWNSQNTERGNYNASYLAYSVYDTETGTWSEPQQVDDNNSIDILSAAIATDNGIYLAYQEINKVYADDETIDFADFSKNYTLTTARFDAETGKFTEFASMPAAAEDSHANEPYFVKAKDGTLYLIWSENTDGNFLNNDSANVIRYATLGEDGWSEPTTIVKNISGLSEITCTCNELGEPVIAYFIDKDCDVATRNDIQLVVSDMAGTTHVLAEGTLSSLYGGALPQGGNGLMWMDSSKLSCSENLSDVTALDTPEGYVLSGYTVNGNRLLFTAVSRRLRAMS